MQFSNIDRIMLMGGGAHLLDLAAYLTESGYTVQIVTSPRHSQELVTPCGVTFIQQAEAYGLKYNICEEINTDPGILCDITSQTLGLSLGAAWIFRKKFIDRFQGKLLNMHSARLPQDRGGGVSWSILRGSRLGCCLIHQVDEGIDTGPIVKFSDFLYPVWCRVPRDYYDFLFQENEKFLLEFFAEVKNGKEFTLLQQTDYLSSYWPRLSTEYHGYLDWSWNLEQIERFICAFDDPYQGASTLVNGKRVFINGCAIAYNDGVFHPFQVGIVYRISTGLLFVATENGTLIIESISDENGRNCMDEIRVGDRFYTPRELLDKALQFRAVYTPQGLKLAALDGVSPSSLTR